MSTWPSQVATDILSGAPAESMGEVFYDRDLVVMEKRTTLIYGDGDSTSGTYETAADKRVYIPAFIESGDILCVGISLTNAGGTGFARLYETGTPTTGDEVSQGVGYDYKTMTLTLGDWAGTLRTIRLQVKTGGAGTMYYVTDNFIANAYFKSG